jgi:hypothetical protein
VRHAEETNSQTLARIATGATTFAISQAMSDLNRSGRVVSIQGTLTIAGETVWLRIRQGRVVAVLADSTQIPWERFRTLLRTRTAA